jgi:RNA polymerase sigma-70 factor (ECF subfamily)
MPREAAVAAPSDEADLIARAILKDEAAVRTLIRRYNQRLYRIARSVVRDDGEAEDIVQQGYVHAFTHLAGFRGEAQFSTWITRIVLNEALGRLRRRRPTVDVSTIDEAHLQGQVIQFPLQPDPERRMAQREIHTMLEQAIDELPDIFRTVLVARMIEGMSIEETAELIGIKPETVKTRLHRARQLVKGALEKRLGSALTKAFPFDGWRCERMADVVVKRLSQTI